MLSVAMKRHMVTSDKISFGLNQYQSDQPCSPIIRFRDCYSEASIPNQYGPQCGICGSSANPGARGTEPSSIR